MNALHQKLAFTFEAAEGTAITHRLAERRNAMGSATRFISWLVSEEIRRIVAEAASNHGVLSAADTAAAILKTYPKCGFDEAEIANEAMLSAARAGVGVRIGRATKPLADLQLPPKAGVHSDRIETL